MFDILSCVPGFNTFSNMFKNEKNDELLFDLRAKEYGLSFLEKISNLYSIVCKEIVVWQNLMKIINTMLELVHLQDS